ncbi:transcriptional regulator [Stutzerimonas stutzeri]|nr:transcriptional regulator [Stutzerimonas stutzeri]
MVQFINYDPAAALSDAEARAIFLNDAFETQDGDHILGAIAVAVRAYGARKLSSETGISWHRLETCNDLDLCNLISVLHVLGVRLAALKVGN